jgi:hypothetical protein
VNNQPFIEKRQEEATMFFNCFRFQGQTLERLHEIALKGYFIQNEQIWTCAKKLLGSRRYLRKTDLVFYCL